MSLLPAELELFLANELSLKIRQTIRVTGGDIHQALRIDAGTGSYFIKFNDHPNAYQMFAGECEGLDVLAKANPDIVPKVIHCQNLESLSFLMLPFFKSVPATQLSWQKLGQGLAKIHRYSAKYFGLKQDNYIGSLPQSNRIHDDWTTFYAEERILPQVKLAVDNQYFSQSDISRFDQLLAKTPAIVPTEPPSLLHGDLWNGNVLNTATHPLIIDPAVYYGHREMDLAMTKLFGGFPPLFYQSYQENFPLESEWQSRIPFFQLYYLLVHVNLFGFGYVGSVKNILSKYS